MQGNISKYPKKWVNEWNPSTEESIFAAQYSLYTAKNIYQTLPTLVKERDWT